jgi:hypothetical protein
VALFSQGQAAGTGPEGPISYPAYDYFVRQDPELIQLWQDKQQLAFT